METYEEEQLPPPTPILCTLSKQWNDIDGFGFEIRCTTAGNFITHVKLGTPAQRVGLRKGQRIIEINGDNVETESQGEMGARIKEIGNRFQILVVGADTYEYYNDRGVAISSTMTDIHLVATPHKPYRLRDIAEFMAKKVDTYRASTTTGRRYFVEVALRLPLMAAIHFLLVLRPTSDYVIVEEGMINVMLNWAFLLFGSWILKTENLMILYSSMAGNLFIGWMSDSVYWTFQNEALGVCSDVWLPWEQYTWWTPILLTLVLQITYLVYLIEMFEVPRYVMVILAVVKIPYVLCSCGLFLYYLSPIQYWVSKFLLCSCVCVHLYLLCDDGMFHDERGEFQIPEWPGHQYFRDPCVIFCVLYYIFCVAVDLIIIQRDSYVFSMSYVTTTIGMWCTSPIIAMGLGSILALALNAAAALCMKLIQGETDFFAIMNSNIGNCVIFTIQAYYLEACIMSVSTETRVVRMESVLFLTAYTIFIKVWFQTEALFLHVLYSDTGNFVFAFFRVYIFSVLLLTMATSMTLYMAPRLGVDTWLLLNVSGNALMLVHAVIAFMEIAVVFVARHWGEELDRFDDFICYTRVTKTAVTIFSRLAMYYYRFHAPFFDRLWIYRVIIIVLIAAYDTFSDAEREWTIFKATQKFISQYARLPDATAHELQENHYVCSICYRTTISAKKLPCSHIFHVQCLREWFKVKTGCPCCNANVLNVAES